METWYVTAILNRCPACHEGKLFSGGFKLRESCDRCGARYDRWVGSWTGPVVAGYGVGCAVAVLLIIILHSAGKLVPGVEWGIALVSCASVMLAFRPIKAIWIGMLYDAGYIFADPPKEEPASVESQAT